MYRGITSDQPTERSFGLPDIGYGIDEHQGAERRIDILRGNKYVQDGAVQVAKCLNEENLLAFGNAAIAYDLKHDLDNAADAMRRERGSNRGGEAQYPSTGKGRKDQKDRDRGVKHMQDKGGRNGGSR